MGLDVADVEIRKAEDIYFLLIKRFDRKYSNNLECERILQEDFAQSLGVQARDKYKVTFRDCLKVLNQTAAPANSKLKFVKQVIFNYLIGNTDAHAKNFSVYLTQGGISLTPAYDLLCSSIYDCDQRIAMKLGKAKYYAEVEAKDWEIFAQDLDISYKLVQTELERQKQLLPKVIENLAKKLDCEVGFRILDYIASLV